MVYYEFFKVRVAGTGSYRGLAVLIDGIGRCWQAAADRKEQKKAGGSREKSGSAFVFA